MTTIDREPTYCVYRKHTAKNPMSIFGKVNGEATVSSHMELQMQKERVYYGKNPSNSNLLNISVTLKVVLYAVSLRQKVEITSVSHPYMLRIKTT